MAALDRFQFIEPEFICPVCGCGPDECDAAYYADVACELAEVEDDSPELVALDGALNLLGGK